MKGVEKGALVLIVSGFVCKVFGAFFRLPLTNIIGIEGIGVFQMVMSIYSLMLVFLTGGVTTALSRLISSARARGDNRKIGGYLRLSLFLSLGLATVIGGLFLLFARSISSLQGGEAYESYRLLIILLPLGAVIGVFRGVLQGYENMTPTAITQIIEQVVKFAFGLLFAYYFSRYGVAHGVYGAFLGITISEVFALIYLSFSLSKLKLSFEKVRVEREFFHAAVPLSLSGAVVPLTHAIDSLVIVSRLAVAGISRGEATSLFGLQTGVVGAILNFPLIISLSVGMALLPKISFLIGKNDVVEQRRVISTAFSLMWFFLLPLVFGVMSLGELIYPIIYPEAITGLLKRAIELTNIGGISIIICAIMQFVLSLLQAGGHYNFALLATLAGGVVKELIVIFTASIPAINIFAIPLSNIALALVVSIAALIKLGSLIKIPAFEVILPLLSGVIMFFSVRIFVHVTHFSAILTLILSVLIGGAVYLTLNLPIVSSLIKKIFGKNRGEEDWNEQDRIN